MPPVDSPPTYEPGPERRRRSQRRLPTLAISLLAVVTLAACGDTDDPAFTTSDLDTLADSSTTTGGGEEATLQATTAGGSDTSRSERSAPAPTPSGSADYCPGASSTDIRFRPGGTSAALSVAASAGQVDLYTLDVRAGQTLTITLDSNDPEAAATLLPPGADLPSARFTAQTLAPTQAGTYRICVAAGSSGADHRLEVSVVDDTTPIRIDAPWCGDTVNDRGEIRFAAGAVSGTVEQSVVLSERDLYSFKAAGDQFIEALLRSADDNAVFDLRTPSGLIQAAERPALRDVLLEDGEYLLCIGSTQGNADYALDLTITTLES